MRKFLEEYGFTILAVIVIISLIVISSGIASPVFNAIKNIMTSTGDKTTTIKNYDNEDVDILTKEWKPLEMTDVEMETKDNISIIGNFTPGQIVSIGDSQYRVLAADGTKVKVLSLSAQGSSIFGYSTTYADSILDNTLNNFYTNLPKEIKESIVDEEVSQSYYKLENGTLAGADLQITHDDTSNNYYFKLINTVNVGNRKVYALGIEDIIEYFGNTISNTELNKFVFNSDTMYSDVWLRSGTDVENSGMALFASNGKILNNRSVSGGSYSYHPVFTLDLRILHDMIYKVD